MLQLTEDFLTKKEKKHPQQENTEKLNALPLGPKPALVQLNLCQKLLFLHLLTNNMTFRKKNNPSNLFFRDFFLKICCSLKKPVLIRK